MIVMNTCCMHMFFIKTALAVIKITLGHYVNWFMISLEKK
jgi:hypothetical protein